MLDQVKFRFLLFPFIGEMLWSCHERARARYNDLACGISFRLVLEIKTVASAKAGIPLHY